MRNFAILLLALPLLVGGQNPAHSKAPEIASRITSTAAGFTYQTYTVSNPLAFPSLPLPARSLVYRGGLLLTPGQDYSVSGTSFHLLSTGPTGIPIQLSTGDHVTVISGF